MKTLLPSRFGSGGFTRHVRSGVAIRIFAQALLVAVFAAAGRSTARAQSAPSPLTPANGANVTVPLTISWSAVLPPGQLNGGYNWHVSTSPSFSPLVLADATNAATTQDTVSGLTVGTYFWRVNAVDSALQTSAWSATRSFNVTGAGPGTPGTPVLAPTRGYSTFHPWESIHFDWSVVPDAVTYRLEVSNDSSFPLGTVPPGTQTFWNDNIPTNSDGYVHTMEGNWFARVFAVDADNPQTGVRSLPSNVIQFSCFFNNPIGPPPVLLSPLGNPTLTLPVTIRWAHVPNPQSSGYILEIATNSNFSNIEWFYNQYTEPTQVMLSLTSGPKFWRVRSQHGLSSPTTNAVTAWSTTGTFTISSAPSTPVSILPMGTPGFVFSGAHGMVAVQLTAGVPPAGVTITMTSSHPTAAPIPASIVMHGTHAYAEFPIDYGQVTTATLVTFSATLNGVTASNSFTVRPPTLNDATLQPQVRVTGGTTISNWVDLEGGGSAGPGGFVVNLSADSPSATVPASVTIPAGFNGTGFSIPTSPVTTTTVVTITASAAGVTQQWRITLEPSSVPATFFVRPLSTTNGSQGTVTVSEGVGFDQLLQVSSSNQAVASVPSTVTVFAGSGIGFFPITTAVVTSPISAVISVTGGGVTLSRTLTIYPSLPLLSSLTVSPTSVTGGNPATGTVTLASPAPSVGVAVNLGTNLPLTASVPESVIIPGGATSATFPVTTFPSATTTVELNAALDGVFRFAPLSVGPPAPPPTPGTPSLRSPASQATVAQPITFDWTDASNAVTYTIQIDTASNFAAPLTLTQTVSASTATITGLPAQQLWWRVRGTNSAGVNGPFSSSRRFRAQAPPAAPSLSAVSVSPTSVVGGNGTTGTVTLTSAAGSGGLLVTLASSNAAIASAPASVTVPSGATSTTFTVTTASVASSTTVTFTGTQGANTRTAALTVNPVPPPASLTSISLNPSTVTGGSNSTGTATLTSAAPSGGLLVSLSSSNMAVATVPASVTVASGATSAAFTVTTSSVASSTAVTITATGGGATRTANLTVNPVPTGPLSAPSLIAPANDARFSPGQNITFDWSDVAGAASYTLQIDDHNSFPSPFVLQQTVTASQFGTSTLPILTMWWRVRANDSAGNPGNWSSVRRVEVKN